MMHSLIIITFFFFLPCLQGGEHSTTAQRHDLVMVWCYFKPRKTSRWHYRQQKQGASSLPSCSSPSPVQQCHAAPGSQPAVAPTLCTTGSYLPAQRGFVENEASTKGCRMRPSTRTTLTVPAASFRAVDKWFSTSASLCQAQALLSPEG